MKVRVADVYCGVGGATEGIRRAANALGIEVKIIGVDKDPQPDYCGDEFYQMDALKFLRRERRKFDAVWASPPCQDFSRLTMGNRAKGLPDNHVNLIPPTRRLLLASGRPWAMENVMEAPIRQDVWLCGLMFGLAVFRHRKFEVHGFEVPQPEHPSHDGHRVKGFRHGVRVDGDIMGVYGRGGGKGELADWQRAMDIGWTRNFHSLAEAIPPQYSQHLAGGLLKAALDRKMSSCAKV